jgi:YidC/Oxa1 family membrane protein insertase
MATPSSGSMDRTQITGLVLIGLLFAAYMAYTSYTTQQSVTQAQQEKLRRADSLKKAATQSPAASQSGSQSGNASQVASASQAASQNPSQAAVQAASQAASRYGALFEPFTSGSAQKLTIETPLIKASYNSQGAVIRSWELQTYKSWFGSPVQLVPYSNTKGALGLSFTTHEGKEVDTRNLFFSVETSKPASGGIIQLRGSDSVVVTARMNLAGGASVLKTMTFYGDRYDVGVSVMMTNMDAVIANRRYELSWKDGIQYQEANSVNESNIAKAMLVQNRSVEDLDASNVGETVQSSGSGVVDYAAIKSQYFMVALKPVQLAGEPSVYLDGTRQAAPQDGFVEKYNVHFRLPYSNVGKADAFTVFIGPTDYDIVKPYGLEATVDIGYRFVIRPIAEYVMLPFFKILHSFIPNYGWAIIVFALLLRLMMQPLMASQMKSSQKMQILAPEIAKIREKHKDDQQAQQAATMKLYGEYGINPAGGCLPLVLQMPIFFALSATLSTIALRQQPFMLWMTDLSVPDVILHLPFKIPLMGVDILSGLAIITAALTLVQSSFTVTDPNQKAMMYMMPVMLIFLFSGFASGVALYYAVFNLIGIVQQVYMTRFAKNKLTLADMKKMPKKEGWIQKKMREAQEIAESQGRSLPGQNSERKSQKRK